MQIYRKKEKKREIGKIGRQKANLEHDVFSISKLLKTWKNATGQISSFWPEKVKKSKPLQDIHSEKKMCGLAELKYL